MSETIDTSVTRRSRADRPSREIHREVDPVTIEGAVEQQTPEDALADSRQQLQERDAQLAQERQRAQQAEQRRQQAEAEAARATQGRTQDRQAVVASAIEAAKAEQTQARTAFRLAREAGDVDAEAAAHEALSAATYRFTQATAEQEWMKNQPKPTEQKQVEGPSQAAQKWLDEHPRYYSDDTYRAFAEGLHNAALRALGAQSNGSQQYIDYIESRMAQHFGEGHGTGDTGHAPVNGGGRQQQRQARGDGLPPSRSAGGDRGGWKTVNTALGPLLVQDRADGTRGIKFSSPKQTEDFREGAQLDRNYDKDPARALAEYTNEHVQAALEGYQDLKVGDGRRYGGDEE